MRRYDRVNTTMKTVVCVRANFGTASYPISQNPENTRKLTRTQVNDENLRPCDQVSVSRGKSCGLLSMISESLNKNPSFSIKLNPLRRPSRPRLMYLMFQKRIIFANVRDLILQLILFSKTRCQSSSSLCANTPSNPTEQYLIFRYCHCWCIENTWTSNKKINRGVLASQSHLRSMRILF